MHFFVSLFCIFLHLCKILQVINHWDLHIKSFNGRLNHQADGTPEKSQALLQSCLATLEQCAHLSLMQKILELAAILLSFNKCVDFLEGPEKSGQYQMEFFFPSQAMYSVNFAMCINTLGGNSVPVSELM
jgi:hypothetical protein